MNMCLLEFCEGINPPISWLVHRFFDATILFFDPKSYPNKHFSEEGDSDFKNKIY